MASPLHFVTLVDTVGAPIIAVVIALGGVAFSNALEVFVLVWFTFRRHQSLYFWSMLIAVWGTFTYTVGIQIDYFLPPPKATLAWLGFLFQPAWYSMVTGQSLVLYSRLHLVVTKQHLLRNILWIIIVNGVVFHGTTTLAATEETLISSLYMWYILKLFKSDEFQDSDRVRRTLRNLIWTFVFIIVMDVAFIATVLANFMIVEQSLKTASYAYKLRLELNILNQLTHIVTTENRSTFSADSSESRGANRNEHDEQNHSDRSQMAERKTIFSKRIIVAKGFSV